MRQTCFCGGIVWVCLALSAAADDEPREWTIQGDKGKQVVTAVATDLSDKGVKLRDDKGNDQIIPWEQLAQEDLQDAIDAVVKRGVVSLATSNVLDQPWSTGSGFVIDPSGLILTNYHVLAGAGQVDVKFHGQKEPVRAECVAVDPKFDAAVLRVPKIPEGCRPLTLAYGHTAKAGQMVLSIGFPRGLFTSDWGKTTGVHKTSELPPDIRSFTRAPDDGRWLQTSAVVESGSSGAPLVDSRGRAIGLSTMVVGRGMALALHVVHVRDCVERAAKAPALALPLAPLPGEQQMAWMCREIVPPLQAYSKAARALQLESMSLTDSEYRQQLGALNTKYRPQFLAVADAAPKSWASFQALNFACDLVDASADQKYLAEISNRVLDEHLTSESLAEFLPKLGGRPDEVSTRFCRRILADSPQETVRAAALYFLLSGRMRWVEEVSGLDLAETKSARAEIAEHLPRLNEEFAKTPVMVSLNGRVILNGNGAQLAAAAERHFKSLRVGLPALETNGETADAKAIALKDYRGKVVMLDFFGDYCPPCQAMYPEERKMVEDLKERPFVLLGVNGDDPADLPEVIRLRKLNWTCLADGPKGKIATAWQVGAVPTIYLVDHAGIVRRRFVGMPPEGELRKSIDALLAEAK